MAFSSFKSPKQIRAITNKPKEDSEDNSKYAAIKKRAAGPGGSPLPKPEDGKVNGRKPPGNLPVDPRAEALKRRMTNSNKQRGKIVGANKSNREAFRDPDEEYGSY